MAEVRVASLRLGLRAFELPDTNSRVEGFVEKGTYPVVAENLGPPDTGDDYICIKAPQMDGPDAWICSRWTDVHYASVYTLRTHDPIDLDRDPMAIPESAVTDLLPSFLGWTYASPPNASYPYPLNGVGLPQGGTANNCCTFVEALLVKAWQNEHNLPWTMEKHRQMMVWYQSDLFSPVTAAVESGMAIAIGDQDRPPLPWTLIQGYRQDGGGHTFIVVDTGVNGCILTLESNSCHRQNGPGYRMIGNLGSPDCNPPAHWWDIPNLWKWEDFMATYRQRKQAKLKITNLTFSGIGN